MCPSAYPHERPDVCAGYLISIPAVIEAARATTWRKEGALREFYDGETLAPVTKFAIDTVAGEMRAVEQHQIREASKGRQ